MRKYFDWKGFKRFCVDIHGRRLLQVLRVAANVATCLGAMPGPVISPSAFERRHDP